MVQMEGHSSSAVDGRIAFSRVHVAQLVVGVAVGMAREDGDAVIFDK